MLNSILNHKHLFIESPTGTGKTLSMLLAASAFFQFLQSKKIQTDDFQIYYCTRTHTQLKQVLHSLTNTPYSNQISQAILASRGKLCINPKFRNMSNGDES